MKSNKKTIKKIIIASLLLFVSVFSMNEIKAAPGSLQMSGTSSSLSYLGMYFPVKYLNDGREMYCLNFYADVPRYKTLSLVGENDAGITKIIQNGFRYRSITGDNPQDYYITSLAIHVYIDRRAGVSDNQNGQISAYSKQQINASSAGGGMGRHIIDLVNLGMNASYDTRSMNMNSTSSKLTLTQDKKYYITGNISVTGSSSIASGYSLNVSGVSNYEVVDTAGNKKTSFQLNENFKVKVPVGSIKVGTTKLKISATGTSTIEKTYRYTAGAGYQDLTPTTSYPDTQAVSASKEFTVNKTVTKFTKTDITGENELDGAHLIVRDKNGKIIEEWDSKKDDPHYIVGLVEGETYTLEETIAPSGYYLSQTVTFSVLNGEIASVDMRDEITKVEISKQDITTKEELEGAKIILRDSKGNIIDEWISNGEVHYIEGLLLGETYTIEEIEAPEGYILNSEKIEFTIDPDGGVTKVVMFNEKAPIIKVPETAANIPLFVYILGLGSIIIGSGVVYRRVKYQ